MASLPIRKTCSPDTVLQTHHYSILRSNPKMIVNSLDIWHYEQPPFTQYKSPAPKIYFVFISIVWYSIYPCADIISSVLNAYIRLRTDISFGFWLYWFLFFLTKFIYRKEKKKSNCHQQIFGECDILWHLSSKFFSVHLIVMGKQRTCSGCQMCFSWFHVYCVTPSPVACTDQSILEMTQSHRFLLFLLCSDLRSITTADGYNKLNKTSLQVPFIFVLSTLSRADSSQYRSVKSVC